MHATRPRLLATLSLALALAGCGAASDGPGTVEEPGRLRIVATTPILGELVSDLVGDLGQVDVLMAPGQDPHGYEPSAQQAGALRLADLVVANGLGLEEALDDALDSAEADGVTVVRVAEHVDPLPVPEEDEAGHGHDDGGGDEHADADTDDDHDHAGLDPHVWLDPVRMADAAAVLAAAVAAVEGAPDADWDARARAAADDLLAIHAEVVDILAAVPDRCRILVTAHDSLRYFAERYDFEVVGSAVPGTSTQAGASAAHIAELTRVLRELGVPAVFAETSESSRLAETLAAEVGRDVAVVELPAGTLGPPGSETDSYRGMMATTATLVADALEDC